MKIPKDLIRISLIIGLLASCTVSEKNWHKAASNINGQSIYIKKDGTIIARIDDKLSDRPSLNIFDSQSSDIGYGAMKILYKEHRAEYENNSNNIRNVYILDLRNTRKSLGEYNKIISEEKMKKTTRLKSAN